MPRHQPREHRSHPEHDPPAPDPAVEDDQRIGGDSEQEQRREEPQRVFQSIRLSSGLAHTSAARLAQMPDSRPLAKPPVSAASAVTPMIDSKPQEKYGTRVVRARRSTKRRNPALPGEGDPRECDEQGNVELVYPHDGSWRPIDRVPPHDGHDPDCLGHVDPPDALAGMLPHRRIIWRPPQSSPRS